MSDQTDLLVAVPPARVAGLVVDLALDDAVVFVVDRVLVAVVVVVVAVVPVLAPVALVGDLAGALLARGADAVRPLHEADDLVLSFQIVSYAEGKEEW